MKLNFRVAVALLLVLFLVSIFALNHVYACLTIAFILAYLLDPIVSKLHRNGLRRPLGAPLTLVVVLSLLVLGGVAIIPKIVEQGRELILRLPSVYYGLAASLTPVSEHYLGYNVFQDVDKFIATFASPSTLTPIGGLLGGVFTRTFQVVTAVLGLLIIPLMAYYLLRDFPKLNSKFMSIVPKRHHKLVGEIRDRLHEVLGGFLRGQLVVSSILSAYYIAAFSIMRLRLAVVLGLMAGFFNVVPYLGILLILALTAMIAFINGATAPTYAGIAIIFAIGMGTEGSVLTPRIVGRRVGLSPLVLIVALMVGGELLGLVGMLLAVPIAAILKVFLNVFLDHYRNSETFKRGS
jgi:predicted PurR-regulated permease PerM